MKLGKLELSKKKLIIGGSVVLAAALIGAGVIFAFNANKTPEIQPEEPAIVETQEQEATAEENKDQTEAQNDENKTEVKNDNAKNQGKKENNTSKSNGKTPVMPEVKTDLKVNGDEVVLNAEGKDGSSKTILTFSGDKLSKVVLEMNSSNEAMLKESKEFYEKSGFKILESNGKSLKVEMSNELIDAMNKAGNKQDIIDFYKQFSEALKG